MSIKAALEFQKLLEEQLRETRVVRNIRSKQAPPRSKLALLMEDLPPDSELEAVKTPRSIYLNSKGAKDSTNRRGMEELSPEFLELVEERQMPEDPTDEVPTIDVERPK